jgi:hypothetical protein
MRRSGLATTTTRAVWKSSSWVAWSSQDGYACACAPRPAAVVGQSCCEREPVPCWRARGVWHKDGEQRRAPQQRIVEYAEDARQSESALCADAARVDKHDRASCRRRFSVLWPANQGGHGFGLWYALGGRVGKQSRGGQRRDEAGGGATGVKRTRERNAWRIADNRRHASRYAAVDVCE